MAQITKKEGTVNAPGGRKSHYADIGGLSDFVENMNSIETDNSF
jgi:hypothetical protein